MRTVKRWVKRLLYVPKYEKVSDKSLSRIMLSSVIGILICGICLAGLTWAWFSSSVASTANNITAANFSVGVEFKQNEAVFVPAIENESYKLNSGKYTVIVTADGSVTTGYCKVELKLSDNNTTTYHTIQLYPAGGDGRPRSIELTVNVSDISYLKITPQWGTYAKTDDESLIGNSDDDIDTLPIQSLSLFEAEAEETQTYHLTESEQSYTVKQGDTLSKIAEKYGTTVEALSTYNNITNINTIQTGSSIKIPPASYRVPKTTTTQAAETESAATEPSVTEPSVSETPKQTTDTSSNVTEAESTEPSSEETVSEKTTASETQSVPDTDTTENATDEP